MYSQRIHQMHTPLFENEKISHIMISKANLYNISTFLILFIFQQFNKILFNLFYLNYPVSWVRDIYVHLDPKYEVSSHMSLEKSFLWTIFF